MTTVNQFLRSLKVEVNDANMAKVAQAMGRERVSKTVQVDGFEPKIKALFSMHGSAPTPIERLRQND